MGLYLDEYWSRLATPERQAIFSRLAAAYLPLIVERIVNPAQIEDKGLWEWINGYVAALEGIQKHATPYLVNYMLSDHPHARPGHLTRRLGELICRSLENVGDVMDHSNELMPGALDRGVAIYHGIFDLLLFLIAYLPPEYQRAALTGTDQKLLIEKIISWGPRIRPNIQTTTMFWQTFRALLAFLKGEPLEDPETVLLSSSPYFKDALLQCRNKSCQLSWHDHQLFQCSRCGTALYCTKRHQIEDWDASASPHSAMCYKTQYVPSLAAGGRPTSTSSNKNDVIEERNALRLMNMAESEVNFLTDLLGFRANDTLRTITLLEVLDGYTWQNLPRQNRAIFSRLAALYLPRIVEKISDNDVAEDLGVWNFVNGYMAALQSIELFAPMYLADYMASNKANGAVLTRRIAERIFNSLVNMGDVLGLGETINIDDRVRNTAHTLSVLLCLLAHTSPELRREAIKPEIVSFLVPRLKIWADRYLKSEPTAAVFKNLFEILSRTPFSPKALSYVASIRGVKASCARKDCTEAIGTRSLFPCDTCKTVLYCSKKHQTEDWNDTGLPHKATCYKSTW
ncbi:hypothetical protein CALVIDRAFT_539108 [Calocera viscosa TUFC12733]|uniref:MYND-type domain-containing protein n=1 Tax=Calocera viscosa (strain TUFC12733) TaxID=1330018 RepID=A0A167K852_CALVF|nr:hypothetical protein CALVIDRAFT_539108 [Calocera viscosa TUFC12733]